MRSVPINRQEVSIQNSIDEDDIQFKENVLRYTYQQLDHRPSKSYCDAKAAYLSHGEHLYTRKQ